MIVHLGARNYGADRFVEGISGGDRGKEKSFFICFFFFFFYRGLREVGRGPEKVRAN